MEAFSPYLKGELLPRGPGGNLVAVSRSRDPNIPSRMGVSQN